MIPSDATRHRQMGRSRALRHGFNNLAVGIRNVKTYHSVCPMPTRARARASETVESPPQPHISSEERPDETNSDIADRVGVTMIIRLVCKLTLQARFGIIICSLRRLLMSWCRRPKPSRPRPRRSS